MSNLKVEIEASKQSALELNGKLSETKLMVADVKKCGRIA